MVVKSEAPEPAKNKERKSEKRDLRRSSASGLDDRLWIYAEETRRFIEVCTIRSHGAAWGIHNGEGKKSLYANPKKAPLEQKVANRWMCLCARAISAKTNGHKQNAGRIAIVYIPLGWFLNAYKYVNCRRRHRGTRWRYQKAKGPKATIWMKWILLRHGKSEIFCESKSAHGCIE